MKKFYRRSISGLLALLICFTTILSSGVTAFAASSSGETAKSYPDKGHSPCCRSFLFHDNGIFYIVKVSL